MSNVRSMGLAMGRLRYCLGACLILILTHSASAAVTDALSQAGFTCLAASDSSGAPSGGTMCTHEAMSTSAFTLDEALAVYVPSTTSVIVRHIVLLSARLSRRLRGHRNYTRRRDECFRFGRTDAGRVAA